MQNHGQLVALYQKFLDLFLTEHGNDIGVGDGITGGAKKITKPAKSYKQYEHVGDERDKFLAVFQIMESPYTIFAAVSGQPYTWQDKMAVSYLIKNKYYFSYASGLRTPTKGRFR